LAIAALVLWLCTAGAGSYLLATGIRARQAAPPPPRPEPQQQPLPVPAPPAPPVRAKDRFDPPSLARAKSEPLPGMRALAEFTHPALAIIGLGVWLGYVLSRDRVFAAIGFGVVLGAIAAGLTWFAANSRAVRRAAAGDPGPRRPQGESLSFPPRLLILHGVGAALTLLLVALITARA
jgi:hypothetical protein